jgi:hypothetical protein
LWRDHGRITAHQMREVLVILLIFWLTANLGGPMMR